VLKLSIARGSGRAFKFSKAFAKVGNVIVETEHLLHKRADKGKTLHGMSKKGSKALRWDAQRIKVKVDLDGELWGWLIISQKVLHAFTRLSIFSE